MIEMSLQVINGDADAKLYLIYLNICSVNKLSQSFIFQVALFLCRSLDEIKCCLSFLASDTANKAASQNCTVCTRFSFLDG